MTKSEMKAQLKILNDSELFYKTCYDMLPENQHTTREMLQQLIERGLVNPEHLPHVQILPDEFTDEVRYFEGTQASVLVRKHNCYTPEFTHRHTFFEGVYVLSGACRQNINHQWVDMRAGDLCLVPPNMYHNIAVFDSSVVLTLLIRRSFFKDIFVDFLTDQNALSKFFVNSLYSRQFSHYILFHTGDDDMVEETVLDMFVESENHERFQPQMLDYLLITLFVRLLRQYEKTCEYIFISAKNSPLAHAFIEYIQRSSATATIAGMAADFGYTPEHLSRLIKKTTGYSFLEILKKERMQKAERLLTKSTMPISEISAKLGYMNPESFVRAFKAITGVSPGVFRQSKQ